MVKIRLYQRRFILRKGGYFGVLPLFVCYRKARGVCFEIRHNAVKVILRDFVVNAAERQIGGKRRHHFDVVEVTEAAGIGDIDTACAVAQIHILAVDKQSALFCKVIELFNIVIRQVVDCGAVPVVPKGTTARNVGQLLLVISALAGIFKIADRVKGGLANLALPGIVDVSLKLVAADKRARHGVGRIYALAAQKLLEFRKPLRDGIIILASDVVIIIDVILVVNV